MKHLYRIILLFCSFNFFINCTGQSGGRKQNKGNNPKENAQNTIGDFENSDFTFKGMPQKISSTDTSAGWKQDGQKILLTGIVYKHDGTTPAPGVLLYYYQTNTEGRYVHKPEEIRSMPPNNLGQTHGYIRGWIKTGVDGKYAIYTVKPGTYPANDEPAHIHVSVKETGKLRQYYIDDFIFEGDPILTAAKRQLLQKRAGSGIVKLEQKGNILTGQRNLILGLNIPGYPDKK